MIIMSAKVSRGVGGYSMTRNGISEPGEKVIADFILVLESEEDLKRNRKEDLNILILHPLVAYIADGL